MENSEESTSEQKVSSVCHPLHNFHRYFFLIFMCLIGLGDYFCYDTPGALQEQVESDIGINTEQFSLLYSICNWVNAVMSLAGGFLVDRFFGIGWGSIICCTLTLVGQLVFGFGALINQYWVMVAGRFIFGTGGETLVVTNNLRAVKYFNGKELNMVFGLQISVSRGGGTLTMNVMEPLYQLIYDHGYRGHVCLGIVLLLAASTNIFDLLNTTMIFFRDKRADRILKLDKVSHEKIRPRDVLEFKSNFWTIATIILFYFVGIFPLIALGIPFYKRKYHFNAQEANAINSIIYIISGAISPFLGIIIGNIGYNITWIFGATISTLAGHVLLTFTDFTPWLAMALMGIGFSVMSCTIWPMISLVVPHHQLGTAFGIGQSIQNLSLAATTWIAGMIVDAKGFFVVEIFLMAWVIIAITFIMILIIVDNNNGGYLNMSQGQRVKVLKIQ